MHLGIFSLMGYTQSPLKFGGVVRPFPDSPRGIIATHYRPSSDPSKRIYSRALSCHIVFTDDGQKILGQQDGDAKYLSKLERRFERVKNELRALSHIINNGESNNLTITMLKKLKKRFKEARNKYKTAIKTLEKAAIAQIQADGLN